MLNIFNIYISVILFLIALVCTKKTKGTKRSFSIALAILSFIFINMTNTFIVSNYFTGVGLNDAVLYHLSLETADAGLGEYRNIMLASVAIFLLSLFVSYKFYKKTKASIVGVVVCMLAIFCSPLTYNIYKLIKPNEFSTTNLKLINQNKSDIVVKNKKNLIIIYAEGFERSYMDESLFPGMTPNMRKLEESSISFTNMNTANGTQWTIAGIVSSQCGIPLVTAGGWNSMSSIEKFYPSAICLSDILNSNGYINAHIQGSSVNFSGTVNFLKTHNFNIIRGYDELKKDYPTSYTNSWGFYDKNVFDDAIKVSNNLSKRDSPFFLTISTMDTHHPKGHVFPSCKLGSKDKSRLENAFKCSDFYISNFVKEIRKSNYSKDTIIVIMSDHLSMRNILHDKLVGQKRNNLFLINTHEKISNIVDKAGIHFDVAPTILSILDTNKDLGIGKSLFSKNKTIFEQYGNKTNDYLKSIKDNFLELWSVKTELTDYKIEEDYIKIGNNKFKIPIILNHKGDKLIPTVTSDNDYYSLPYYLIKNMPNEKFSWIDDCTVIKDFFELDIKEKGLCTATGTLGGKIQVKDIELNTDRIRQYRYVRNKKLKKNNLTLINNKLYKTKLVIDDTPTKVKIHNYIKEAWYKVINKEFYPTITGVQKLEFMKELTTPTSSFTQKDRFIAHAGGEIDGHKYTNTLEALNLNYKKGFRYFELDLIKTSDDKIVAAHDWKKWKDHTNYKGEVPPTLEEFKKHKILSKYTPISMSEINDWFKKHPEAVLVTDKIRKPKEFIKRFKFKNRVMMEVFDESDLNEALSLNITAMPTSSLFIKMLRTFEKEYLNKVKHVAISRNELPRFIEKLMEFKEKGVKFYAYHVRNEKNVACNEFQIFHGMYADNWNFKSIECN